MKIFRSIGLMSGTSMDGVDAAYIESDGRKIFSYGSFLSENYPLAVKNDLRELIFNKDDVDEFFVKKVEEALTNFHAECVEKLIDKSGLKRNDFDLIGFHGHTVEHDPSRRKTWQIGNGTSLAKLTGVNVVYNFRYNDVLLGGQGAPLIPLYHKAIARESEMPVCFLNIGGVSNLTFIGDEKLIAFDTGPGNALIDDFMFLKTGRLYDKDGELALVGKVSKKHLDILMSNIYFAMKPPKSLDRNHFANIFLNILKESSFSSLPLEDAAATISEFTVQSIKASLKFLPKQPNKWYICGGGFHNKYLLKRLRKELGNVSDFLDLNVDINPDAIEAQGFAYLAIRSSLGLPITFSTTTGIKKSSATGGVFCPA